jgi:hypothetical protein
MGNLSSSREIDCMHPKSPYCRTIGFKWLRARSRLLHLKCPICTSYDRTLNVTKCCLIIHGATGTMSHRTGHWADARVAPSMAALMLNIQETLADDLGMCRLATCIA